VARAITPSTDGIIIRIVEQTINKTAIDLDGIGWKIAHMCQRRIAGPKIVQGNLYASNLATFFYHPTDDLQITRGKEMIDTQQVLIR